MRRHQDESYEDIIGLPHPVSRHHPPMSLNSRAAQFAPFAALDGYEKRIEEEAKRQQRIMEKQRAAKGNDPYG